jgi:hypothetical protein
MIRTIDPNGMRLMNHHHPEAVARGEAVALAPGRLRGREGEQAASAIEAALGH